MRARTRRWAFAVLLMAGAEGLLLLAAGLILGLASAFHASLFSLVGAVFAQVVSILPVRLVAAFGVVVDALGAGWWQTHLVAPAIDQTSESGLPALGGVLAAPVYTVLRRTLRATKEAETESRGAPPHRVYITARA